MSSVLTTDHGDIAGIVSAIKIANSIVMACHVNPDGDALGSLLGLGIAIMNLFPGKVVTLVSRDGVPEIYQFLPQWKSVKNFVPDSTFDLAIVLDSGDISRIGAEIAPVIQMVPNIIDIDHHVGEGAFGNLRLVDPRAAATAEIVYGLIKELGGTITLEIAKALLTGIVTDTGAFRFMNVTSRTLRIAASLTDAGGSTAEIAEQVFDNRRFNSTRLMGLSLAGVQSALDGRIAWAHISYDQFISTGSTDEDTEGLIGYVRSIRGVEVAALFRETQPGISRISLRSTQRYDVAKIAARFGGGGHKMASGCTYTGPLADAEEAVVAAIKAAILSPIK